MAEPLDDGRLAVAVVDDDAAARTSLVRLLDVAGFRPCPFESAAALLDDPNAGTMACIVTDLQMPGATGLDLQKALSARGISAPLIFVTGFGTVPTSVQAMRAGAVDFIEKPAEPTALLAAVERAVAAGRLQAARHEQLAGVQRRVALLTAREREVFDGVVLGLPNKQIAAQLGIALKTVKVHRGRVMQKMEAPSVADLVRAAEILEQG
jgi:FixJ family two-component response regulator